MKIIALVIASILMVLTGPIYASTGEIELPPGVTMQQSISGPVFADANGLTLYMKVLDRGLPCRRSAHNDCHSLYRPLLAPAGATPSSDWTVVKSRESNEPQWAFEDKAVYTYSLDSQPGTLDGELGTAATQWVAVRIPQSMAPGLKTVATMRGDILVEMHGWPLYTMNGGKDKSHAVCSGSCLSDWRTLSAPTLAHNVGDFTIFVRDDGSRQWAYKGEPLYSFKNDNGEGELRGEDQNGIWRAVVMVPKEALPVGVTVQQTIMGSVYADATGKTLYSSVELLPAQNLEPIRALCADKCEQIWHAVIVPNIEVPPGGSWSAIDLPNGRRQLAYRKLPLYTYKDDAIPGDIEGDHYAGFTPIPAGPTRQD